MATPAHLKPTYEKDSIKQVVTVTKVEVTLSSDWSRYSNGTFLMGYNMASFMHNGKKESVVVMGTGVEVSLGEKKWQVSLEAIVRAAMEADKQYEASAPPARQIQAG